jgi:starch synthase (maltosyl-transferring)
MKQLAKLGYTQSYSYFTWRTDKAGLTDYFSELYLTDVVEYMRPNLFANTPDILHESLQYGGRPAFMARAALAATLGASYGVYGPPFELCVGRALRHGSEEYLDSEKYQVRHWDLDQPHSLRHYLARLNQIRRENPALQDNRGLRFFHSDNDQIICYGKATPELDNVVVVTVNLDPHYTQSAWVRLPLESLGLRGGEAEAYRVHELIGDAHYLWRGESNFVILDPHASPAQVFQIRRRVQTERDFDYYA